MNVRDSSSNASAHSGPPQRTTRFDVTIASEIISDLTLFGLPRIMSAERELLASDFRLTRSSNSAIVIHHLATLGVSVRFIALVGHDPLVTQVRDRLAESELTSRESSVLRPAPEQA